MRRLFSMLCIVFTCQRLGSQVVIFPDQVDTIWENGSNKNFIKVINKEFNQLISKNADSILLFYPVDTYYIGKPFSMIVWKKGSQSHCMILYQNGYSGGAINKEISTNDSLKNVSIKSFHEIMEDPSVRTIDTNILVSHQDYIFCQFYFDKKKKLTVGLDEPVYNKINKEFLKAFRTRNYKLYWRN